MITQQLLINLLLILVVAWVLGELFARFGLPVMLGELLAGIILGPPLLGVVTSSPALNLLADLGHIIIGAAIADDILAFITLSVILGVAKTGVVQFAEVAVIGLKVVAFFGFTILAGHFVLPKFTRHLHDREGKAFTFAMTAALGMAYLAELAGLHFIIGAFLAGQFVREEIMDQKIYNAIRDRFYGLSYGFLVPIFFASLSFHLHFELTWDFLLFSTVITLVAIAGKLGGCGIGLYLFRRNFWEAAIVGFGMNGRGAVELVIASVFLKVSEELVASGRIVEPLITENQFSALILMAFITTLIAPVSLRWAASKACSSDEKAAFCNLWNRKEGP